jgi:hypothetical protein
MFPILIGYEEKKEKDFVSQKQMASSNLPHLYCASRAVELPPLHCIFLAGRSRQQRLNLTAVVVQPTLPSFTSAGCAADLAVTHLARGPPPGWCRGGKGATAGPRSAGEEVVAPRVEAAGGGGRGRGWRRGAPGGDERGLGRRQAGSR